MSYGPGKSSKSDETLLKEIHDRFKLGLEADQPQRKRDEEALRMYALDQWPEPIKQQRMGQGPSADGLPATPARPMLVVDRLREPVAQVVNLERESDLSVELVEAGDFSGVSDEAQPVNSAEIELREGIIRRIQRESESASARTWAFLRSAICGRGYYVINTRYADGKTFDQEIYCRRIYDQTGVILDPAHEEPDASDAEWGFVYTVMSFDAYKAEHPRAKDKKNELADCSDSLWDELGEKSPGWFTLEGERRYVRVAEHWYTERKARALCELRPEDAITLPDGQKATVVWKDQYDLPEGVKPLKERTVVQKVIRWCKVDGCQILDETDWPSPYVPIVKVVGNEIPPCDQERRVDGMVNKSAIESQRGINYTASKLAEEVGLSAVSPLMATPGQIEGFEPWYQQLNVRAFPYIPYNFRDAEGVTAPVPFRPDKSPQIAAVTAAFQMFAQSVQTSTGVPDPNMGRAQTNSPTWRGTRALLEQGQRNTSNFLDNLARSVRHEGRIMNSLLYTIYGNRPGRLAQIVRGETDTETVMVGQPFMMRPDGQGREMPVPAPPGATGQMEGVREYQLTEHAQFNVAVKVTKNYDTRREQEAQMFGELLAQAPQLMTVVGDLFFASQDWPGAKDAAERIEVMLDPKVLAMLQQKKGGQNPIPPMALQQMQMLQQQNQQLTQAAQQMQQDLQAKVTETQVRMAGEKQITEIKAQLEETLARIKADAEIRVAELKAGVELQASREKAEAELQRQRLEHIQDINQAVIERELNPEPEPQPAAQE